MDVDLNDRKHGHVYPRVVVCAILFLTRIWTKDTYVVLLNYLNLFSSSLPIIGIVTLPIEILSIEEKNYDWQLNIYRKKEKIKSSSQEQTDCSLINFNRYISSDVHLEYIYIYIYSKNNHTSISSLLRGHCTCSSIVFETLCARASREGDHFKLDEYSITSNPTEQGIYTHIHPYKWFRSRSICPPVQILFLTAVSQITAHASFIWLTSIVFR